MIQLNAYNQNQAIYSKPVHSNDSLMSITIDDYQQGITCLVRDVRKPRDHWKGFLAIIENGAELAHIWASSADRSSRGSANQVNAAFDILKPPTKLFGHYATDETSHFAKSVSYDYNAVAAQIALADTLEYYDLVRSIETT